MDIRFDGKRALVTGAGKGMGRAITKALLAGGAETYALTRTQADLDSLKQECPRIHTVCVDLADWDATRKAVQDIGPIDLLVNNAGMSIIEPFLEATQENIDNTLNINLKAAFNVSQVVAKGMVERGQGGAIVNTTTTLSMSSIAMPGYAAYLAAKGGLEQLTKVMALELGPHQIRVNAVGPTLTNTRMGVSVAGEGLAGAEPFKNRTPLRRLGEVSDIVHAVLYLLSDKSDMISGVMLPVDGGVSVS